MKYEIIDNVSRFVKRFGMIMDPETMKKAKAEAGEYGFRIISKDHYAVMHGDKMYVIIERDGEIGCSCDDMTFNRMDGSVCKHIIEFSRLMSPPSLMIDEFDEAHLVNVCGWTGKELHPEVELGGPGAVVQEDTTPAPDEPEGKIYTRRCKHCDEVFSGRDLDVVKKELADHLKVCGMNPRAKPHKKASETEKKDNKVDDPTPHIRRCKHCGERVSRKYASVADAWLKKHEASCPKNPANQAGTTNEGELTGNCQWCGKEFKRYSKANLKAMIEEHEASCPKNPDVGATFSSDEITPEDVSDKPQDPPTTAERKSTALSTGQEFPDEREFTSEKVRRHVENRGGFYKNQKGEEVPDSAAMSLYALDTCRISTETILIEKNADQAKAIVRGHKGGISVDASVILRFDVLRRRELLKMAKKYPKAIMNWTEELVPILDLNFVLKDKTPVVTLGEHMFNFAIDQEQFAERTAETLARRRAFDMLTGVDWRDDAEVQVEDADAASMGGKKR